MLRVSECRIGISFWEESAPSKRDILVNLMRSLSLLSEALPIAMRHISKESIETQANFWCDFADFDRLTDITTWATGETEYETALAEQLEDWRQLVECRISKPAGPLLSDNKSDGPATEDRISL